MPSTENGEHSIVFSTYVNNTVDKQIKKIGEQSENTAQKASEKVEKKISAPIEKSLEKVQKTANETLERIKEPKSFKLAENALDLMELKLGNLNAQIGETERKLSSAEAELEKNR